MYIFITQQIERHFSLNQILFDPQLTHTTYESHLNQKHMSVNPWVVMVLRYDRTKSIVQVHSQSNEIAALFT